MIIKNTYQIIPSWQELLHQEEHIALYCSFGNFSSKWSGALAVGSKKSIDSSTIRKANLNHEPWFGHILYDYKNTLYPSLNSKHRDVNSFPDIFLFTPKKLIRENQKDWTAVSQKLINANIDIGIQQKTKLKCNFSKEEYLHAFSQIKKWIQLGDFYEVNFCIEFTAKINQVHLGGLFTRFAHISQMPFTAFYRYKDQFALVASPERFLKRNGNKLISEPIKGTIARGKTAKEDDQFKRVLEQSTKERSENIMIVDLVRNDLSKIAVKNSVSVTKLCEIVPFKHVFQSISTVECEVEPGKHFHEILSATFPMGSMTGAPKHRVMRRIEEVEKSSRGIYSGSIGYIEENGDFDWNVVIRSLKYNAQTGILAFNVGSAITHLSSAEEEYNECILKAKAIAELLDINLY